MILLDTNVISEAMREAPSLKVVAWMRQQPMTSIYLSAINVAEIMAGIEFLPEGRHREDLRKGAQRIFARQLSGHILPFDETAADTYADTLSKRSRMRRPIKELDAQIAAIARGRGLALATRDVDDFLHCGIQLINPWSA